MPKSGSDLNAVGKLFSQFLAGQNQTLSVQGDSVQPTGTGAVGWLSSAFKTLTLQVILPGHVYQAHSTRIYPPSLIQVDP